MALDAGERFRLADRVMGAFDDDPTRWSQARINLLFQQFELPVPLGGQYETVAEAMARILAESDDTTLLGIAAAVLDLTAENVRAAASHPDAPGMWKDGYVRVFLSHSAVHKEFVGEVSRELAVFGIHGFVAHDSMAEERRWQPQIEVALRSAEAFVALVHPPFNDSAWCQQEVGWAQGRSLASYFIRFGADPRGFPSATQWPSGTGRTAREVAVMIVNWVERQGIAATSLVEAMISALADAGNYFDAEAAAKRIVEFGDLPEGAWQQLEQAYWKNDQVFHGVLANRVLRPYFGTHDREFPPPRP